MVYLVYIVFFFALGFCLGWMYVKVKSHTLDDYNQMYSHLTCEIVSRMTKAMRSLLFEQDDIDRVIDRMGCKIMPTSVLTPPPTPPEKPAKPKRDFSKEPYTLDEVINRLSPIERNGKGEWYCFVGQPHKAWRIDRVDNDHRIVRQIFHDMKTHELHIDPAVTGVASASGDTIEALAKIFIDYNFRFLDDFDRDEWKLYEKKLLHRRTNA